MVDRIDLCALMAAACVVCSLPTAEADGMRVRPGGLLAGIEGYDYERQTEPLYPGGVEYYRPNSAATALFDKQSLLKAWSAPGLPMPKPKAAEQIQLTVMRKFRGAGPFPVIRCREKDPVFTLDCGELPIGLYAIRVIATVDREKLRPFREPVYIGMAVNDLAGGGTNVYRVRIGYADDLFSVAEIYFHALEKRAYRAELWVDRGSTVDLLVHTLTLDDALAGIKRGAFKTRRTLFDDDGIRSLKQSCSTDERAGLRTIPPMSPDERLQRDERLWNWLPPLNAQGAMLDSYWRMPEIRDGAGGRSLGEIEAEHGKWESPGPVGHQVDHNLGFSVGYDRAIQGIFLVNGKLGLSYTMADLAAHRPLPDPYPFKDDGAGLYFPDPTNLGGGQAFCPIAQAVGFRLRQASAGWGGAARLWVKGGNEDIGRDAAVQLVRYAFQFPAIDASNFLLQAIRQPGKHDADWRCHNRMIKQEWMFSYDGYLSALDAYDLIFDYIKDNQALADSLRRFVPWIETPADVIGLLDTYLVQHTAKRTLRNHDHTWPGSICRIAAAVGNPEIGDEWVRAYAGPLKTAVINATDREGCKRLGSSFYCHEEGASQIGSMLDSYIRAGGSEAVALIHKTPRPLYQCEWALGIMLGGWDWIRVGDVTGPGAGFFERAKPWAVEAAARGWRWEKDPRFAWILKHVRGRAGESEAEWRDIEKAALTVPRAPWLDNRSRAIDNWAGILETGLQHDDPRFRRAAYVRTGLGSGHAHQDALDLHVLQGGLHAMIEGGQRSGYSKPNDKFLRLHNTVEVCGTRPSQDRGDSRYAYTRTLADLEGARYLEADGVPPANARLYRRQVILVDVDKGEGSRPLTVMEQLPGARLPTGVVPANAYVVDVFRVSGGGMHSYCFHGPVNDEFKWNAESVKPVEHVKPVDAIQAEADYLSIFELTPESKQAGDAPETLEAVWRMVRFEKETRGSTSEEALLAGNFEPTSPRRFTKLHLLGAKGLRLLKADVLQTKCAEEENARSPGQPPAGYRWTCLYARKLAEDNTLESAFAGVVEPYLGEPFIASTRLLPVAENETDARRAVAVEVALRNGRRDIGFADGRPVKHRRVQGSGFGVQVSGQFAFYSTDSNGFRQAALAGGTLLEAPGIRVAIPQREYTGTIVRVEADAQAVELDAVWPAGCPGEVVEIAGSNRRTSFTLAERAGKGERGTRLVFSRDALESIGATGAVAMAYAPGDTVRLACNANVRRVGSGAYEVTGNADVEVTLAGKGPRRIALAEFAEHGGRVSLPADGKIGQAK